MNRTCQLCNKTGHTANECYKIAECQTCHKVGHPADRCRGNVNSQTTKLICQYCNKPGHAATNCPDLQGLLYRPSDPRSEARAQMHCQLCEKSGHTAATYRDRPQPNRNNAYDYLFCSYCKNKGHTISECRKREYNNRKSKDSQSPANERVSRDSDRQTALVELDRDERASKRVDTIKLRYPGKCIP